MMSDMMMMQMTFYWGKDVTILFDFWHVGIWTWYVLSLAVVFIFSVLHQFLASQRSALSRTFAKGDGAGVTTVDENGNHRTPSITLGYAGQKTLSKKVFEAVLFGFNVGLGYLLMLAVMTFNGGVFMAIVAGLSFGHFLFRSNSLGGDSVCGAV